MNILGVNIYGHDTAACLVINGNVVAAVEEERLSRIKHDKSFPLKAIIACLNVGNIAISDIDLIAVSKDFELLIKEKYLRYTLEMYPKSNRLLSESLDNLKYILNIENEIRETLGYGGKIEFLNHHHTHFASSYFPSGFSEAALVSIDGLGEIASTVIGVGEQNEIKSLFEINFPHSLGILYASVTAYLGFDPNSSEGTTMALASFGNPNAILAEGKSYYDIFKEILRINEDGSYDVDLSYFNYPYTKEGWVSQKFIDIFGPRKLYAEPTTEHHINIASAWQKRFEDAYLSIINLAHRLTKKDKLCLAGGCALNCVANGKILSHTPFKEVYIQPAAGDSGSAIGSALLASNAYDTEKPNLGYVKDTYYGPSYSDIEIEKILKKQGRQYSMVANPSQVAAELLSNGKIIGWFQGRMEFGPRALGNRSILANPSTLEMKDRLNRDVKHREAFRPFAPSVLKECIDEYFESTSESPFMLLAFNVKSDKLAAVPAIVHADGTGRVQSVEKDMNRQYYELIKKFKELTGIPVVLNTSFNDKGEPIVCTPEDALRSFDTTNLDALIIGSFLVLN